MKDLDKNYDGQIDEKEFKDFVKKEFDFYEKEMIKWHKESMAMMRQ